MVGKWNQVPITFPVLFFLLLQLKAFDRDIPFSLFKIKFGPLRVAQFTGPQEDQRSLRADLTTKVPL